MRQGYSRIRHCVSKLPCTANSFRIGEWEDDKVTEGYLVRERTLGQLALE
uniref:Transposase n=1 Tax=Heterorhabditis bacteriophora TaxID=37862 RepID=A0A1I7XIX8_HETBA